MFQAPGAVLGMELVIILPVGVLVLLESQLIEEVVVVVVGLLPAWSGIYIIPNQEITEQHSLEVLEQQQQQELLVLVGTEKGQHHH